MKVVAYIHTVRKYSRKYEIHKCVEFNGYVSPLDDVEPHGLVNEEDLDD